MYGRMSVGCPLNDVWEWNAVSVAASLSWKMTGCGLLGVVGNQPDLFIRLWDS